MRALIYDYDVPDKMTWSDHFDVPEPGVGEVKVKVISVGLNPLDWKMPEIPGLARTRKETVVGNDFSGKIIHVGPGVSGFRKGDLVYGTSKGTLAEFCVASQTQIATLPSNFPVDEAGAYPICAITAYQGLRLAEIVGSPRAKKILILGAAGGVGHMAVQIAAKCSSPGNHIIGVCAGEHEEFVRSLGAKETFDYKKRGFDISHCVCDVDVIFDTVSHTGFDYEPLARRCLKQGGHYIATNSPNTMDWIRTSVSSTIGINFQRSNYNLFMADINTSDLSTIASWVSQGKLQVHIQKTFNFTEKECFEAIDFLKSSRLQGKILVRMNPPPQQ
jgi:NADPH:quinone reductase-like Zn-dependent oxidoreductase